MGTMQTRSDTWVPRGVPRVVQLVLRLVLPSVPLLVLREKLLAQTVVLWLGQPRARLLDQVLVRQPRSVAAGARPLVQFVVQPWSQHGQHQLKNTPSMGRRSPRDGRNERVQIV